MSEQAGKYRVALPDNNPKTRVGGALKVPLHLVPATVVAHMAMAFADGGIKYQPYNWRVEPISASVYYGAARRHIDAWWEGEDTAGDSGVHHLAHAMACLAMILDTMERPGCLNDNRPPPSDYPGLLDRMAGLLPALKERPEALFDLHEIPRTDGALSTAAPKPEEAGQEPQLVRIKWRNPNDDWEWFHLLGERSGDLGREFYLRGADDPVCGASHDGDAFWARSDEIEWMKRSRAAASAEFDQRINGI